MGLIDDLTLGYTAVLLDVLRVIIFAGSKRLNIPRRTKQSFDCKRASTYQENTVFKAFFNYLVTNIKSAFRVVFFVFATGIEHSSMSTSGGMHVSM